MHSNYRLFLPAGPFRVLNFNYVAGGIVCGWLALCENHFSLAAADRLGISRRFLRFSGYH